jgi:hypothetical protein
LWENKIKKNGEEKEKGIEAKKKVSEKNKLLCTAKHHYMPMCMPSAAQQAPAPHPHIYQVYNIHIKPLIV